MELCAVFETWHLGDGNYPPLTPGMLVKLSLEVQPAAISKAPDWTPPRLDHLGGGEYAFSGRILRVYDPDGIPLVVIDTGEFRFYVYSRSAAGLAAGEMASGRGTLVLDHYIWVEFLHTYADPPDLFFVLRVDRIQKVKTPERLIHRGKKTLSYPTRALPAEYAPGDAVDVDTIHDDDIAHYIVYFSDEDVPAAPLRPTFLGWPSE